MFGGAGWIHVRNTHIVGAEGNGHKFSGSRIKIKVMCRALQSVKLIKKHHKRNTI